MEISQSFTNIIRMFSFLPPELHELITDYLAPREYLNYRKVIGQVGKYNGRKYDVQGAFEEELRKMKIYIDYDDDFRGSNE